MLNQLREGIFSMRSLDPKSSLTLYSAPNNLQDVSGSPFHCGHHRTKQHIYTAQAHPVRHPPFGRREMVAWKIHIFPMLFKLHCAWMRSIHLSLTEEEGREDHTD